MLNNFFCNDLKMIKEFEKVVLTENLKGTPFVKGDVGAVVMIHDNGKGFEGSAEKGGHGLKNLSARLLKLGGSCTVESRVAGGTVVRIRLPLSQPALV